MHWLPRNTAAGPDVAEEDLGVLLGLQVFLAESTPHHRRILISMALQGVALKVLSKVKFVLAVQTAEAITGRMEPEEK